MSYSSGVKFYMLKHTANHHNSSTAQRLPSTGDTEVPGLSTNIIEVNENTNSQGDD